MQDANSSIPPAIKAKDMNKVEVAQALYLRLTRRNLNLLSHKHIPPAIKAKDMSKVEVAQALLTADQKKLEVTKSQAHQ